MNLNLLIFDMDGVLIDVSKSYRKTIQRTVQLYLENCLGFERKKGDWISLDEISLFKSAGGFNNDWDLASGILLYLLSLSNLLSLTTRKSFLSIQETLTYLKIKSSQSRQSGKLLVQNKHLQRFLKKVKSSGGGLKGIRKITGNSREGWVYGIGNLDQENIVQRIFQEIYLGNQFNAHYHLPRLFYKGKGLYLKEKMLTPQKVLSSLREKVRMGIASGRPRFEAELALKRFRLSHYFNSLVTLNECEAEEKRIFHSTGKKVNLSKPHPYSLLRAIQKIRGAHTNCGYVGDVVDDMQAALSARKAQKKLSILAIGFLAGHRDQKTWKKSLIRAGADLVIKNPQQLLRLVS